MCIRDSQNPDNHAALARFKEASEANAILSDPEKRKEYDDCLLYTSDAADERSSVDLGGRRIIKKKTNREINCCRRIYTNKIDEIDEDRLIERSEIRRDGRTSDDR